MNINYIDHFLIEIIILIKLYSENLENLEKNIKKK
jgi:hypothetical protein